MRLIRRPFLALAALLAVLAGPATTQQLKPLTLDDYPKWSRITDVALSHDGRWMSFGYTPNDGDPTLHIRDLDGTTVHTTANATGAAFSSDGRWAGFLISPTAEEQRKLVRDRQPVIRSLELLDLRTGARTRDADVASFRFAENARFVAIAKRRADNAARHTGADLVVRDLSSGATRNIGNVAAFAFNEPGTLLAYTVDAAGKTGNGLYLLDPATGTTHVLDSDTLRYAAMSWSEDGTAVAVLRGEVPARQERRVNSLIAWRGVQMTGQVRATRWEPRGGNGFPDHMVLSEEGALTWDEAGTRIFLGLKEQRAKVEARPDAERTNVEVWHWADDRVISQQKVQAAADARSTWAGVLHLDNGHFVLLADEAMPRIQRAGETNYALGFRDAPYRAVFDEPGNLRDVVRIDLTTGARQPLVERVRFLLGSSPDGRWHAWFRNDTLWAQEIATGRNLNLSALAGVSFLDLTAERPGEKNAYGVAGWARDGRSVLVNHRYDLWRIPLDGGAAMNLTRGVGDRDKIRFRLVSLDPEADEDGIDTSKPLLVSAYGDWSKQSGYWTIEPGQAPRPLLWEDKSVGGIRKARDADRVILTRQTFEEFPDYWATTTRLEAPRRITDANPQQKEYAWGRRVLVEYTDARGNQLQATLALPAGYRPGQRYPMIVYFYERMSQNHHVYSMPVYDDRVHMSTYASNGYLVLQPDITYTDGQPGSSALDDVTAATRKVIELGYADPARIGLQGHSWGGYQSSFIVTQTDMFAAVVTGAPLTNLESMHNILYKQSGNPNASLIQWGQGRMGTVPWEDPEGYASQSPIRHVTNIRTPFLILHGTADGAVDWNQGLEFYIAARRAGKQVILLSYPDEPHHLARKPNQIDFQRRMREYFDHHLLGTPAPPWMIEGVRFSERDREARP